MVKNYQKEIKKKKFSQKEYDDAVKELEKEIEDMRMTKKKTSDVDINDKNLDDVKNKSDRDNIIKSSNNEEKHTNNKRVIKKKALKQKKIDDSMREENIDIKKVIKKKALKQKNIDDDTNKDDIDDIIKSLDDEEKKADEKKSKMFVCRRIRIYPTRQQKNFFSKCFGTTRYFYNKSVEYTNNDIKIKREAYKENVKNRCIFMDDNDQCCDRIDKGETYFCEHHKNDKKRWRYYQTNISHIDLRKAVMTNDKDLTEKDMWQKEIPYDTRQLILRDFVEAYNVAKTNKIRGNIKEFKMGFKSRKDTTQIFHVNKKAIDNELSIFKQRKLGKLRTRNKMKRWVKKNIENIDANCKIICYGRQQYYLLLSVPKNKETNDQPFDIAALDPGVRTFQTMYSPNGMTGKFGDKFCEKILVDIAKQIDKLDSVASKSKSCKTRLSIRRKQSLLRTKIKNIVNNLHWETINFLCKNFKTIITTYFNVKDMTNKLTRNIQNKSVRQMLTLSHYAFKLKLSSRCEQNGNKLIVINESYTSKTCGRCGHLNKQLRGGEVFNCKECKLKLDRDINGARNIFIRLLS